MYLSRTEFMRAKRLTIPTRNVKHYAKLRVECDEDWHLSLAVTNSRQRHNSQRDCNRRMRLGSSSQTGSVDAA